MSGAPSAAVASIEPSVAPPPGNPRFPLFDSLRGLACLGIVGVHLTSYTWAFHRGWLKALVGQAGVGIAVFFLMSGFLLYRPFVVARLRGRRYPSLRRYARARALRLVPGYWLALTCLALWPGLPGQVFGRDWWRYYGFAQDYSARTVGTGIGPAWTLGTELCFVVMLPLYALLLRRPLFSRSPRRVVVSELVLLGVIVAGTLVFRSDVAFFHDGRNWPGQTLPGTLDWFASGMALAAVSAVLAARTAPEGRVRRLIRRRPGLCWTAALAILCVNAAWWRTHVHSVWATDPFSSAPPHLLYALAAVLLALPVVFGDDAPGLPRRLLRLQPLATLGVISYGVYLWHVPLLQQAEYVVLWHSWAAPLEWPLRIGAVAMAILCGLVSYRLVERPLLLLKDGLRRRERAPERASTVAT